jgi:hypothetical protein
MIVLLILLSVSGDRYPLVALSEVHGNRDTKDFLARLIRHPGFAGRVNDIAIAFGNARYQAIVDRYIAGEPVDRESLRGTWKDTAQISDIWSLPMYEESSRTFARSTPRCRRPGASVGLGACGSGREAWA